MTHEELARLDPQVVRSMTDALRHTIDYHKGRGAMLRSLRSDSQTAATVDTPEAEDSQMSNTCDHSAADLKGRAAEQAQP